uniref:Uncharacterized protein n=1 Tax=Haptolina ericina TaxID=156174 RepID=A0A7S3AZP2_9EUKA
MMEPLVSRKGKLCTLRKRARASHTRRSRTTHSDGTFSCPGGYIISGLMLLCEQTRNGNTASEVVASSSSLVGVAALAVPLLGEAKVAQELRVHPLLRTPLPLSQLLRLLDAVAVVLI